MSKLKNSLIIQVREFRSLGKTYSEINLLLNTDLKKSTLSSWCAGVSLPIDYKDKIKKINEVNLKQARIKALQVNKLKRKRYLSEIDKANLRIAMQINKLYVAKIALSMLCLGEASKYGKSSFALGNTNPKIIVVFLQLLKLCFDFDPSKVRCTVQCRADQNIDLLESYWSEVTNIPRRQFYKAQIDPRTIGKPTRKPDYMGVLRLNYLDSNVQLELESLSSLIYNRLSKLGPVV